EAGTYTLRITFIGYQALETELTFGSGETVKQTFKLEPRAVKGEEVTVTIGSRAAHTAADGLAVPVDVFTVAELEKTGTAKVGQMLQQVSPAVNFPKQTVADGMDALRSFTMRGLSPDHTLINKWQKTDRKSTCLNSSHVSISYAV